MTRRRQVPLLLAILGVVVAWLIGDLGVWHGPLRHQLERLFPRASPVVARVFQFPITRSQLDRAVSERLWRAGQAGEALTPAARQVVRAAALDDLIDHELLRVKAMTCAVPLAVSDEEVGVRLRRWQSRFDSPEAMVAAMQSQGIAGERDLRAILAAHLQQEKYLESKIGLLATPTDEEARQWYDRNQASLAQPERVEVRQIFLATLDHPPEEARVKLGAALADLTAGRRDFAALAREVSEDPATKDRGGELGWMSRDRLPADFATPIFALALHQPTLVHTHLGWHLVEVTGRRSAEPRTYPQAKPEILAALEAVKRSQLITDFRNSLRRFEAAHIEVDRQRVAE